MQGRTVILVSHHVQLCAPGASYIIALDNGRVLFQGSKDDFYSSGIIKTLVQCKDASGEDDKEEDLEEAKETSAETTDPQSETSSTLTSSAPASVKLDKKPARKLVEEEKRAVGRIGRTVWETYIWACGSVWYWSLFILVLIIASASPVLENGWLRSGLSIALTVCTYWLICQVLVKSCSGRNPCSLYIIKLRSSRRYQISSRWRIWQSFVLHIGLRGSDRTWLGNCNRKVAHSISWLHPCFTRPISTASWVSSLRRYPFPRYCISRSFAKSFWERFWRLAYQFSIFKSILTSTIYRYRQ